MSAFDAAFDDCEAEDDTAVPMDSVVQRIDPTGSNPIVQANAAVGFRMGVVLITADEYENARAAAHRGGCEQRLLPGL